MSKRRPTFAEQTSNESYYDLIDDYDLIEASFAQQYGIRLRREEDMSWCEFTTLLAGLNEKTPLGRIVAIRSENDREVLKHFNAEQKRIRNEWRTKHAKTVKKPTTEKEKADYAQAIEGFKQMFLSLAK